MSSHHPGTAMQNFQFLFDIALMLVLYAGGAVALNTDLPYVLTVIGSSFSGAIVLAYFKRDRDYREIAYKTVIAAMCGLVSGAMIIQYLQIESTAYIVGVHFFASLLSLFLIRALLNMTEQNAGGIIVTVFQRILGPQSYRVTPEKTEPPQIETSITVEPTNKGD